MSHSCFFAPISGRVQIGVRILKSTPCVYITGMQHQGRVVPPPFFAADTFLNFTHKNFCWSCIINETETNEFLLNSTELPSSPLWIRQVFSFLMFNPPPCLFFLKCNACQDVLDEAVGRGPLLHTQCKTMIKYHFLFPHLNTSQGFLVHLICSP